VINANYVDCIIVNNSDTFFRHFYGRTAYSACRLIWRDLRRL